MKLLRLFILYRLPLGLVLILFGVIVNLTSGILMAWILYFLALLSIVSHYLLGPMRLVQQSIEEGDVEKATQLMEKIRYPQLLIKPIRSAYYFMKSNMAMVSQDLNSAEDNIRKSLNTKSKTMKEYEGMSYFQLGAIAFQKGDLKNANIHLRESLRIGLPDKENTAAAYLQLASIAMNRRDFKSVKVHFKKAKDLKPTTPEIANQIREMEKYISRMPG
ncbi:MAG: tetratricopeptide repeat protein [Chitinophagaceae bacterium]